MRIIFFGTPVFAARVLDFLLKNQVEVAAVVSKPDRPKGRSGAPVPTPVKEVALAFNIPVYQPEIVSSPEFASVLTPYQADLFVVVAYGEILKQHLLDMPKKGCINLHMSLLPQYRGAAPIQKCIIDGETESAISIIHMAKKMDAGDIIYQEKISIGPDMTFGELDLALNDMGKKALLETIHAFEKGNPPCIPQDHSLATFAPKIELEDCEIHWDRPAQELHNLIRGVNPYPGAWAYVLVKGEKKRLKITKSRIVPSDRVNPGQMLNVDQSKGNLLISTADQALELLEVQLEGKKSMSSEELARGIPRAQIIFKTL